MDEQSELGERPRATLIYRTVASFLSISRSTGGSVGPTERSRGKWICPSCRPKTLGLKVHGERAYSTVVQRWEWL